MSRMRRLSGLALAAALGAGVAGGAAAVAGPGQDVAHGGAEPANLGQVKLDVQDYYGDWVDDEGKHHHSQDSRWAKDTQAELDRATRYLEQRLKRGVENPAIVLDIDDTSIVSYGWEADNDFGFDPAAQEDAINRGEFPANEATLELAQWADARGVDVYFLTGRDEHQKPASMRNLANMGYPEPADAFFDPETEEQVPDYLACGLDCTTVEYKSGTRAHLEQTGATVVLNVGDQYSDLEGGHAERSVKLPNPMYYID